MYSVGHEVNLNTSGIQMFVIIGSGTGLLKLKGVSISSDDVTENATAEYSIRRMSVTGLGGTPLTTEKLDSIQKDPIGVAYGRPNFSGSVSNTAILLMVSININSSFVWQAKRGKEFLSDFIVNNGLAIYVGSPAPNFTANMTMAWEE